MNLKKSQISLFILISLIILIAVSLILYMSGLEKDDPSIIESQRTGFYSSPVYVYTEECIKNAAFKASTNFGYQQGYHIVPDNALDTIFYRIAYYYLKGDTLIPANDFFEKEFSKIMDDQLLEQCTDFSIFEDRGYTIDIEKIETTTKILDDKVLLNINFPISIKIGETSIDISKFTYTLPVRLGHIIDTTKKLVEEIKKEPYAIDLTFLLNQDVDISIANYDSCNQVYVILDNESETRTEEAYVYSFAVGFKDEFCYGEAEEIEFPEIEFENNDPILNPIPNLETEVGKEFLYQLESFDPDKDTIFYLATDILTNSTNVLTGLINFTPIETDKGIHLITITTVDISGAFDQKEFYLTIE